jgi:threonine dehydratase
MMPEQSTTPDLEELTRLGNGVILRGKNYTDIDDARTAAERLAEERG